MRIRPKCNDPDTYTPTLGLLSHTTVLLDFIPVSAPANYVRCISRGYHNLAGTLYQNSKYGATKIVSGEKDGNNLEFLWKDENASVEETYWIAEHLCEEVLHLVGVEDLVHDSAFVASRLQAGSSVTSTETSSKTKRSPKEAVTLKEVDKSCEHAYNEQGQSAEPHYVTSA
ncbi:hypothetical protein BDR03DRAFT_981732 [Suillus americanus]|nr:hypothetical protein BDR03DRAFT_981732 [Suillus americanus]